MRCNRTNIMILVLVAGLFTLPQLGLAQPQDSSAPEEPVLSRGLQVRLDRLASEAEGYSYRVGYSPAMEYSLDELCGLVKPDGLEETATLRKLGNLQTLPSSFDWRSVGLPPVRNQGGCGSCWAFGTVGPLESQIMIQSGTAVDLSEQYLVSCNTEGMDCVDGGWFAHDYHEWRIPPGETEAGAVLEADFPYTASDAPCNSPYDHAYRIDDWAYVAGSSPSVADIKQAIYQYGPVGAAVAVGPAFQGYSAGVFDNDESAIGLNHAIVLVGWDDAYSWDGDTYGVWILRNSWGSGWGDGGYMYITYDTSLVGSWANYVEYIHDSPPEFALVSPEEGASASAPPTFSWTGACDMYLFYSIFYYDFVQLSSYYPVYFFIEDTSVSLPSGWWDMVDGAMPSYWTVCGLEADWECMDFRSFTKGVSGQPGN